MWGRATRPSDPPLHPYCPKTFARLYSTSFRTPAEVCDNPRSSLPVNKLREILLTEYIGAILVALLASEAIIALVALLVGQIYWHAALAGRYHESLGHSILTALVKMLLYLGSAYLLARWLYGAKPPVTRESTESLQTSREV